MPTPSGVPFRLRRLATRCRLAVLLVATAALSGACSLLAPGDRLDWPEVAASGWPDGTQVVAAFTTYEQPVGFARRGFVAFVDGNGAATLLPTEPGDGGVASAGGVACVETQGSTYRFTARAARRWSRGGRQWHGAWTGVGPGGECRSSFDARHTEVFRGSRAVRQECRVAATPDRGGQTTGAVYVSSVRRPYSLYRCAGDAPTGSPVMAWDTWRDPRHRYGRGTEWTTSYVTSWHASGGKLWAVESVLAQRPGEVPGGAAPAPGRRGMVRLASLDLRTHTYRSTLLYLTTWLPFDDETYGFGLLAATGSSGGYLHDGSLWVVDVGGRLTRIDLADRSAREQGRVHLPGRPAQVGVAWHEDELWTLLVPSGHEDSLLLRYRLDDAHELARTAVTGLRDVSDGAYMMSGMAVVAPAGSG